MPKSTDTWNCLRCGKTHSLGSCLNCGHESYRWGIAYWLECEVCDGTRTRFTCTDCGTVNPAKKVLKSSKCFIATAAYGSPSAKSVVVLRNFRDAYLGKTIGGRYFIKQYEKYSPPIAFLIARDEFLKVVVRKAIVSPIAWLVEKLFFRER